MVIAKALNPNEQIYKKIKKSDMYSGCITTACDKTMDKLLLDVKPMGLPTISLYKGSRHIEDFKNERTYDNVLNFISNLKDNVKTKIRKKKQR